MPALKPSATAFARWMENHDLNAYQAAEILGLSASGVYQYRSGIRTVPGPLALLMRYIDEHGMPDRALPSKRRKHAFLAAIALALGLAQAQPAAAWSVYPHPIDACSPAPMPQASC